MAVRILLIDDSAVDRELARYALARLPSPPGPVELHGTADWAEAALRLAAGGLDLVLLDHHLPRHTGLEILREIKRRWPRLPVVMLTGQEDVSTAVVMLREGAHDYVPKSADWSPALCLAIERVLARVELERELAESRARLAAHAEQLEEEVARRTAVVQAQAAEIQKNNVELGNANRAKDLFLASMSHELRTPLNAIIGFTGALLMKFAGPLTSDQERQLKTVQASGKLLLSLINDLLDLAKIESGKVDLLFEPVGCQSVVEEVATALRPLAEAKGLLLGVRLPSEEIVVQTNRRALSQIVINLANNAIKFTERGEVRLEIARRRNGAQHFTEISVVDNGIGIRPEDEAKLFQAFEQAHANSPVRYEGSGLGLYLSQKLSTLLGAHITFQSQHGKGSKFTLVIPNTHTADVECSERPASWRE